MKEGYKMTEIGEIPVDWEVVGLKNIGKIVTGSTPSTLKPAYYTDNIEGFMWASPADLGKGKYVGTTAKKLTLDGLNQCRKIPPKSIMVTCIGSTIGKIGMALEMMSTNQQINSIVCDYKVNSPDFFYYIIESQSKYIKSLAGTHAVPLLNKSDFSNILVPLPPLPEQQKIATILSTVDEKIEVIEAQIAQTQQLKKGLMQKLLTEGIGHTSFKDSALGKIPESWEVVKLGEVGSLTGGNAFKASLFNSEAGEFQVIRMSNVQPYGLELTKNPVFIYKILNKEEKYILKEGDLLITLTGTMGKTDYGNVAFIEKPKKMVLNQRVGRFEYNSQIFGKFLYYIFNSEGFKKQFYDFGYGGTGNQANVNKDSVESILVPLPPIIDQNKIANLLNIIDEKLEVLQSKKEHFQQLKKGLMQQLLTGRVRVLQTEAGVLL